MKNVFLFFLLIVGCKTYGQALQNINYNYLYDPETPFLFTTQAAETNSDSLTIAYNLSINDTAQTAFAQYTLSWELRQSYSEKESQAFVPATKYAASSMASGNFSIAKFAGVLCAKVASLQQKKTWYFIVSTQGSSLASELLAHNHQLISNKHTTRHTLLSFKNSTQNFISYYGHHFPAASPAFVETQALVSPLLKADSIFQVQHSFTPTLKGLYLLQRDTSIAKGLAFRIEADYPKFTSLQNLAEPLTYITTKGELERIKNFKGDKKIFDKTILGIAGNAERAKIFMRNYFKRIELANLYFTSYKEGWKTDRGMVYSIYGKPRFVYKFSDRELWEYETGNGKTAFTFVKSSSLFDPDNFVLVRKKSYRDEWLAAVDLVRNARF
jgi:GWxTD domain-containing protein